MQIPPTMSEYSTLSKKIRMHRDCDIIYSLPQKSSHTFIRSSTSAEYTTLSTCTFEKHGDYDKVLNVFPNS